jgi:hypothetical protein
MDKQRPVNKVAHNDAYSASLMEMYTNWMDGDCFQGSHIPEYTPEAFEGMDPQSHGAEVDDITKKKKKIDKKEKSVAEEIVLEREEIEVDGEVIIIEKVKMDGVDDNGNTSCWKGYKKQGTKKKGGKEVNNCVKAGFEPTGEEIKEKKLDPVGKEDKDIDNDGDHDKSDKYLLARRKKVSKIIGMSKKK